jgi:hypothetical protein
MHADGKPKLPVSLLRGITVDPVYAVGPVIAFLSQGVGQVIDRIVISRADSLVAGAQQDDHKQKKEQFFH